MTPYWTDGLLLSRDPASKASKTNFLDRAAGLARACSRITGKDEAAGTAGADFNVQRELLRHSTIQSTLNTYTQEIPEQKRAAKTSVVGILFNENASVDQSSANGS
jgi:hypothetical protein